MNTRLETASLALSKGKWKNLKTYVFCGNLKSQNFILATGLHLLCLIHKNIQSIQKWKVISQRVMCLTISWLSALKNPIEKKTPEGWWKRKARGTSRAIQKNEIKVHEYFTSCNFKFNEKNKQTNNPARKTIHILRTPLSYLLPWQSHNS